MKDFICKQCQTPFKGYLCNGPCSFCSVKCNGLWKSQNLRGDKLYNWKPKKHCVDCGKVLSRRKYTRCIKCSSKDIGEKARHFIHGLSHLREGRRIYDRRARDKRANAEGSHTEKEWLELKDFYGFMCLCCKRIEPEIKLTEDHIIPIIKGGSDYIENIQPLCKSCNSRKHVKFTDFRKETSYNAVV